MFTEPHTESPIIHDMSMCQRCVCKYHPDMLSTYAIIGQRCDSCGYVSDLAFVQIKTPIPTIKGAHA